MEIDRIQVSYIFPRKLRHLCFFLKNVKINGQNTQPHIIDELFSRNIHLIYFHSRIFNARMHVLLKSRRDGYSFVCKMRAANPSPQANLVQACYILTMTYIATAFRALVELRHENHSLSFFKFNATDKDALHQQSLGERMSMLISITLLMICDRAASCESTAHKNTRTKGYPPSCLFTLEWCYPFCAEQKLHGSFQHECTIVKNSLRSNDSVKCRNSNLSSLKSDCRRTITRLRPTLPPFPVSECSLYVNESDRKVATSENRLIQQHSVKLQYAGQDDRT